jgi:hypothetical protein
MDHAYEKLGAWLDNPSIKTVYVDTSVDETSDRLVDELGGSAGASADGIRQVHDADGNPVAELEEYDLPTRPGGTVVRYHSQAVYDALEDVLIW